jgi:hypothetical protein
MNKNSFLRLALCCAALLLVGCGREDGAAIRMAPADSAKAFADAVSSVELVPLETDDAHLLGIRLDLVLLDEGYLVVDKQRTNVFRFSPEGRFLNEIGRHGNGPGEYNDISTLQVLDGAVHLFCHPGSELVFSPDGTLLEQREGVPVGFGAYRTAAGLLTNYGYSKQKDCRVVFTEDGSGRETGFLPLDANLLALESEHVFSALPGGGVCVLDSYSPTVYVFEGGELRPYLDFDFGQYAIAPDFFRAQDAFKAAEMLMAGDYALIWRYLEGTKHKLVQVNVSGGQTEGGARFGLHNGKAWAWFVLPWYELENMSPFCCFGEDVLYGLFFPGDARKLAADLKGKIANPGVLDGLDDADNPVIARIRFR